MGYTMLQVAGREALLDSRMSEDKVGHAHVHDTMLYSCTA